MTKRVDVIIDIETLDTRPTSQVIAIGAVVLVDLLIKYEPENPDLHKSLRNKFGYHQIVKAHSEANTPRSICEDTVRWWSSQPDYLKDFHQSDNGVELSEALRTFSGWCQGLAANHDTEIFVWGNGSVFDITILEDAFNQISLPIPWKFWNIRDVRTLLDVAHLNKSEFEFEGVKHYALDDAFHEAKLVSVALDKLANATALLSMESYDG